MIARPHWATQFVGDQSIGRAEAEVTSLWLSAKTNRCCTTPRVTPRKFCKSSVRNNHPLLRLRLQALVISLMSKAATATPSGIIQKPRTGRIPKAPAMIKSKPTGSLRPLGTRRRMRRSPNCVIARNFLAGDLDFAITVGLQFLITLRKSDPV